MKKVAGYIKPGKKADEDRQCRAISDYCMKNDMAVVEWIGKGTESFGEIAYGNWMGHRKYDAVIAASCGDVTENVYEFYAYRCKLRLRGSDLYVTKWDGYAGYNLYRKIFEEFTETLCRMELDHDPVTHANGRARKALKGGYIGGQAPMGYKVQEGKLMLNPDEVPVVELILERKHEGKTMLSTVDALNAGGYKTRKGGKFVISTVQSIWNNEKFYHGYYKLKDSDEWVQGQHEAIIKD